jgi:hypothetical protein
MVTIKNILVGFLVSFVGSIPLGYLNVIGFEIYKRRGLEQTQYYLIGVVLIEFLVVLGTLLLAHKLNSNRFLLKFIEGFSVIFMFVLAYVFYTNATTSNSIPLFDELYLHSPSLLLGVFLSSLNFIQIPFWLSWNLYLVNGNYIEVAKSRKYFYVFGTLVGTFFGMLVLILSLYYFATNVAFLSNYLMKIIIPLVFLGLGVFQLYTFYKKYNN